MEQLPCRRTRAKHNHLRFCSSFSLLILLLIYLFYSLVVTRISLHLSSAIHVLHCCHRAIRLKFHGKALFHPPRACVGVCVSPRTPRRRRFVPPRSRSVYLSRCPTPCVRFFFFFSVAAAQHRKLDSQDGSRRCCFCSIGTSRGTCQSVRAICWNGGELEERLLVRVGLIMFTGCDSFSR